MNRIEKELVVYKEYSPLSKRIIDVYYYKPVGEKMLVEPVKVKA